MIYKDFKNISIESEIGISQPGAETFLLAKYAKKLEFDKILDMGTGTGFIPIYLSKCNCHCTGVDINPKAIECAINNSKKNNTNITFLVSDLFEKISDKYSLIIFNPPLGSSKRTSLNKQLEVIKSLIPRENKTIRNLSYRLIRKQRRKLITEFLNSSKFYLSDKGKILIHMFDSELDLLNHLSYEILENYENLNIVKINS